LATLKASRDTLTKEIEALGVRARIAVLASWGADSIQVQNFPPFHRKRRGAPTKKALTRRKNAQIQREQTENAAREALKAEVRAELAQEKARLT
jgi:hypothetical protein